LPKLRFSSHERASIAMSFYGPGLHVSGAGMPLRAFCAAAAVLAAVPCAEGIHVSFFSDGPVGDLPDDARENDVLTAVNSVRPLADLLPPASNPLPAWTPLPVLVDACFRLMSRYWPLGATKRSGSLPADQKYHQERLDLSEHLVQQGEATTLPPQYYEDPRLQQFLHAGGARHSRVGAVLVALGGGIGFTGDGDPGAIVRRYFEARLYLQTLASLLLVITVYCAILSLTLCGIYWRVHSSHSPVTYYADPSYSDAVMDGYDLHEFLAAFNHMPRDVQLQVTGFSSHNQQRGSARQVRWQGNLVNVAFSFVLDLTTWVVREEWEERKVDHHGGGNCGQGKDSLQAVSAAHAAHAAPFLLAEGMETEELSRLQDFLQRGGNDLATVELHKEVAWHGWEDLATNIKQHIRQRGFDGMIDIRYIQGESLTVYKNRPWANFMHSRTTRLVALCSVLGVFLHTLYMNLRRSRHEVRVRHRVNIPPQVYWDLIADRLSADGFQAAPGP